MNKPQIIVGTIKVSFLGKTRTREGEKGLVVKVLETTLLHVNYTNGGEE